ECHWGVVGSAEERKGEGVKLKFPTVGKGSDMFALEVEVWNEELTDHKKDILIGRGKVQLSACLTDESSSGEKELRHTWVDLTLKGKKRGKVELCAREAFGHEHDKNQTSEESNGDETGASWAGTVVSADTKMVEYGGSTGLEDSVLDKRDAPSQNKQEGKNERDSASTPKNKVPPQSPKWVIQSMQGIKGTVTGHFPWAAGSKTTPKVEGKEPEASASTGDAKGKMVSNGRELNKGSMEQESSETNHTSHHNDHEETEVLEPVMVQNEKDQSGHSHLSHMMGGNLVSSLKDGFQAGLALAGEGVAKFRDTARADQGCGSPKAGE
ncbi:unnamed protein product, partial [Discosporangium mesarthrocarpum]